MAMLGCVVYCRNKNEFAVAVNRETAKGQSSMQLIGWSSREAMLERIKNWGEITDPPTPGDPAPLLYAPGVKARLSMPEDGLDVDNSYTM